jgi:hypothetical protein
LLLAAIVPLREDSAGVTYDPGGHVVAGLLFFVGSGAGLLALSWRLARDPRWRSMALYTRAVGILVLTGSVAVRVLVMPDDALLHDWAGVVQRAFILVLIFPCRIVLAVKLLHASTRE